MARFQEQSSLSVSFSVPKKIKIFSFRTQAGLSKFAWIRVRLRLRRRIFVFLRMSESSNRDKSSHSLSNQEDRVATCVHCVATHAHPPPTSLRATPASSEEDSGMRDLLQMLGQVQVQNPSHLFIQKFAILSNQIVGLHPQSPLSASLP